MFCRGCFRTAGSAGSGAKAFAVSALASLPFPDDRLPRFPQLSMGRLASGNGIAGDHFRPGWSEARERTPRSNLYDRFLAPSLAFVSADAGLWLRQAAQRRSHMAQPDRTELSLPDPAAADLDRLVCASTAAMVAQRVGCCDVRN